MTNYSKGARFEREVRAYLEKQGWAVVRSAGSKGPCDLVAMRACGKTSYVRAIACKMNGYMPEEEGIALVNFAEKAGAYPFKALKSAGKIHVISMSPVCVSL